MERPLRPEEASLEKKGHTPHRPAGVKSCITAIQSSPQFLGMGPTHSSLKITKEDAKKKGTQSGACTSNTVGVRPQCRGPHRSDQTGLG